MWLFWLMEEHDCEIFAIIFVFDTLRTEQMGFVGWPGIRALSKQLFVSPRQVEVPTLTRALFMQAVRLPEAQPMDSAPKLRRPSHTGFVLHLIAFTIIWSRPTYFN